MKPPIKAENEYDEGSNSVVVGIINAFRKELEAFQQTNIEDRAAFKAAMEASLVDLRKDFHRALINVALDNGDHRAQHANDVKDRIERQSSNDLNFRDIRTLIYILTGVVIGLFLIVLAAIAIAIYLWSTLVWRIGPIA